ncbi:energy transducer TonB [Porphyrobacter sp. CACIAM 03H1]|jgi:protein TonB|uniref:energy transducer TonB n=1 Tax=Porphyrobacter sp. CACIAM 03H1 TaxID=2003315 RepID=UPI000B5A4D4B|nr:energy transducer TonB [Porphyrobacter sp. CACIAM 03H1]ASJ89569.1 energy transducer TonB [Porphyrobacter sp. CACIAM 03H1]
MSYASQQQGLTGPKLVSLIIALSIVGLVGTGMVLFLAVDAVKEMVERVTTVDVTEEPPPPEEEPPPPEEMPEPTSPPPPVAPPPPFNIAPNPPQMETRQDPPPPAPVFRQPSTAPSAPPGPPEPPRVSKARGVQPKNQRSWAARIQENYPRRAAQEEIEGTVGVRVTVTPDGRATGCSVTSSSGSDILDSAACKDLERYGRFDPALDDDGSPISASWSTRITYKLN